MTLVLVTLALVFFAATLRLVAVSLSGVVRLTGGSAALQFDEAELLDLVAEKRGALTALKETELDYETGKVGEKEYSELHAAASGEVIEVMKQLDAVRTRFRYSRRIDEELEALTRDGEAPAAPVGLESSPGLLASETPERGNGPSEAARIRARLREGAEPAAAVPPRGGEGGFCVACGEGLVSGARFCAQCGHAVGATVEEAS